MVLTSQVPQDRTYVANVNAAGAATITVTPSGSKPWLIQQVSIEMLTAPTGADCFLRKRGAFITRLVAAGDAAGGDPPLVLYPGEPMTIEWVACTPNQQGQATVIYQVVEYG